MNATEVGTLLLAAVAVAGSIGSVLTLAYRVGKLTGTVEARMNSSERGLAEVWKQLGGVASKLDRHIERHGR